MAEKAASDVLGWCAELLGDLLNRQALLSMAEDRALLALGELMIREDLHGPLTLTLGNVARSPTFPYNYSFRLMRHITCLGLPRSSTSPYQGRGVPVPICTHSLIVFLSSASRSIGPDRIHAPMASALLELSKDLAPTSPGFPIR